MASVDTEFERCGYPREVFSYQFQMARFGVSKAQAKRIVSKLQEDEVWVSGTHQVAVNPLLAPAPFGSGTWLSIKRLDKSVIDDRHELVPILHRMRPGYYGFELFPAPSRLVDSANQFHLWTFAPTALAQLIDAPWLPASLSLGFEHQSLDTAGGPYLAVVDVGDRQDWRQLYEWKEKHLPGREAAMFFHPDVLHPLHGKLLCLTDENLQFPFGFQERAIADSGQAQRMGGSQRSLDSYSDKPVPQGLGVLGRLAD